MDAYIWQAGLWCGDCIAAIKSELEPPADPENESIWDSDEYPKGPYSDGGGEADTPKHCDGCGKFLRNPLTADGGAYVLAKCAEHAASGKGNPAVIAEWRKFYDVPAYTFREAWDEFKIDFRSDRFGHTTIALMDACAEMTERGLPIPDEWQYRGPAVSGDSRDWESFMAPIVSQMTNDDLTRLARLLCRLYTELKASEYAY